jgi:prepilin-type N-terminal cleavage/methylation domain-containing protein
VVNSYTKRSAFTLIELIFAIVIIAISVASVPIMTNAIGKGVENNLVQETIFGASAQINQVLSYRWDENSINEVDDPLATGLAKVIDRNGTACDANRLKPGHIFQPLHRMCLNDSTVRVSAAVTFGFGAGKDGSEPVRDDIDDFDGVSDDLFTATSGSAEAYKQDYTYEIDVVLSDMNGTLSPIGDEAKEVIVTVKDEDGDPISQLNAYTFNIGEVDYYKRMYP